MKNKCSLCLILILAIFACNNKRYNNGYNSSKIDQYEVENDRNARQYLESENNDQDKEIDENLEGENTIEFEETNQGLLEQENTAENERIVEDTYDCSWCGRTRPQSQAVFVIELDEIRRDTYRKYRYGDVGESKNYCSKKCASNALYNQ